MRGEPTGNRSTTEAEIAEAVAALLRRVNQGPASSDGDGPAVSRRDRRVVARTVASSPSIPDAEVGVAAQPFGREAVDVPADDFDHHSQMVTVATTTIRRVNQQGRLLTLMNRREVGARRGMIVSGPWTTGKSTALKQLGRTHELMIRQRFPDSDRIPVVYVTCPPKGSPRQLAVEFARFLGLPPVKPRFNVADIADIVCRQLIRG